jgi:hypothetical protein
MRHVASLLLSVATVGAESVPERWIDAIQIIESGGEANPDAAIGDGGKARGRFQFHKSAWEDCSKVRKANKERVHPYAKAKDPVIAREYARTWLTHLRRRLTARIGRPADAAETWLLYNLGWAGFERFDFHYALVPPAKFEKALAVLNLSR